MNKMSILIISFMFFICVAAKSESNGFFTLDKSQYKTDPSSVVEVTNMPPVRSQDSIGICYAFEAGAAVDAANCKAYQRDCSKITDKDKASVLDLARYGDLENLASGHRISSGPSSEGLGGDAVIAINESIFKKGYIIRESCAPFDQIVAKQGSPEKIESLQEASWKRLKNAYDQFHQKLGECQTCALNYQAAGEESKTLEEIKQDFHIQKDNAEILKDFTAKTYSSALDQLLIPEKCTSSPRNTMILSGRWDLNYFPKDKKDQNYSAFISKVKNILKEKNPIMVNGYCALDKFPKSQNQCDGSGHGFLISGYRKVCDSKNNCKEAVKVHNSWGQNWQDQNDSGWVDAKSVFDRTYYGKGALAWLQEKD